LVVVTQKEFQHPSDLLGKKVMGTTNEIDESTLVMMFKKFDMGAKDFTTIPPSFKIDDFIAKKSTPWSYLQPMKLTTLMKRV